MRVVLAAVAGFIIAATPARAVHLDSFQLDGDAQEVTCGGAFGGLSCPTAQPDDWDSLYACPTTGTGACSKITASGANLANVIGDLVDEFNSPDPDNFGQGSKDDMNVTAWNWTAAGGSAKTNIMQSFAAKYDGDLYIGANRDINNGDANFGVWLLQNATVKCTTAMKNAGQCATVGTFVGKPNAQGFRDLVPHRIGDILIVSAFTNGGTVANIQVYKVIQTNGNGSNPNAVPGTCPANAFDGYANKSTGTTGICLQQLITQATPGTAACNTAIAGPPAVPADAACAATNASVIASLDPRFLSTQSGSVKGQYPALTFFEVGLNLDDLGLTTECFPNYIVEGRQSQSVTASLNDFTIGQFQSCESGIKTQASGPVTVGQTITDTATLSGTSGGATPTGSITFKAYSDLTCSTQVFTDTKTVSGFGDYTSAAYTTTAAGTIYWIASYTGDANFPAATGACGDANESSVVNKATPGITTSATAGPVSIGSTINDTATLSGGFAPLTGTVTFTLYGPGDASCSLAAIFTSTVSVVSGAATSGNYTTTAAGTYRWKAAYSGDSNNDPANSACNDANEASVVQPNSPALSTAPTVKVIHSDSATLSGGASPTGTMTFNLYQNTTCTGTPVFTATKTVAGNGSYASGDSTQFTVSGDTEFRWTVSYSGDANNNGKTSGCGAEKVVIDITP
jgi:hypothetical protein